MELIPDLPKLRKGGKPEQELVENEKQEYKLIGRYLRTRGLRLFAYNSTIDQLYEVDCVIHDSVVLVPDKFGKELIPKDLGVEEANIHTAHIHFEALNLKSARHRVFRFKAGKLKELCNLKRSKPTRNKILLIRTICYLQLNTLLLGSATVWFERSYSYKNIISRIKTRSKVSDRSH